MSKSAARGHFGAVAATKAALAEGIVPGGGVTLVNLADGLKGSDAGTGLLREALYQPFRMSDADTRPDPHASNLGEHTREVLRAAGLSDAEIDALG